MNENMASHNESIEIDLQRLLRAILRRIWLVIAVSVCFAVLTFGATFYFVTPLYESTAMFYVNNNSLSVGDASFSISSSDITASKSLVDSYIVILKTRETLNDVLDYAGVEGSYRDVQSMITAEPVNDTEIFRVTITNPDPEKAEKLADAIAYILPKRISSIIEGTSAKIVDSAIYPVQPSSPSYLNNTLVGFVLGFLLSVTVVTLREIFDVTIRNEEDIARGCKYPVLAMVPNMAAPSRSGYYSKAAGKNKRRKNLQSVLHKDVPMVGSQISFAASEAYKLLRTKLQFSFADENTSRIIGVSSALAGEGKSLTSTNLAYSLSELGKRVLLIDCDMRRPSINVKLPVQQTPGLSDYLSGQTTLDALVQPCGLPEGENAFSVIAAGRNPPNPTELLSSARMSKLLQKLRTVYDYVILDLPPISEVSDAIAVAKETDGILLVVRQNYGNYPDLAAAVREFEFVGAKLLGVVSNCAQESGSSYSRGEYYRKRYYKAANEMQKAYGKK